MIMKLKAEARAQGGCRASGKKNIQREQESGGLTCLVSSPCACHLIHINDKLYSTSIYKTPLRRPKAIRRMRDLIEHKKHVARMQESPYKVFVGEAERKIPLEDLSLNGNTILMGLKEVGWEGVYWMHLARDRDIWLTLVNCSKIFGVHKTLRIS
jgi:hypothetical protein